MVESALARFVREYTSLVRGPCAGRAAEGEAGEHLFRVLRAGLVHERAATPQDVALKVGVLCEEMRAVMAVDSPPEQVFAYMLAEAIHDDLCALAASAESRPEACALVVTGSPTAH
jgi:hypothetical protein